MGPESPESVGDGDYVVEQGECLSSIAFENGFLPNTLWNLPENAALKEGRKSLNLLFPGDRVHIPDPRVRAYTRPTDKTHKFVRLGVPEVLLIVLHDSAGKPRKGASYKLLIDGKVAKSGECDSDGKIQIPIVPNAGSGELVVRGDNFDERYDLDLGALDPVSTVAGVQARLDHLGFPCGPIDGNLGPMTEAAIKRYQESEGLEATGELGEEVRDRLRQAYGF